MSNQSYTINLLEKDIAMFKNIDVYSYSEQAPLNPDSFFTAYYVYFDYYLKRTPEVKITIPKNEVNPSFNLGKNTLNLCLTESKIKAHFLNLFKNKKHQVLYLARDEATKDIERTWKTIQEKRDLSSFKKIVFSFNHWSKLVYAYRAHTVYTTEIEDIS